MRLEFENGEQLDASPRGLEIGIKGFRGDPTAADGQPTQVCIEFYEGKLKVHVCDGASEDAQTITIDPVRP